MYHRIGFTRRAHLSFAKGIQPTRHALSGKWRDKKKTTALALCGAPCEPPADGRMEPSETSFGLGENFHRMCITSCRRCERIFEKTLT